MPNTRPWGHRPPCLAAVLAVAAAAAPATIARAAPVAAPSSVAEAVALAADLARADGRRNQPAHAHQADRLASIPAEYVVPCLAAFADATPAGANWLRSGLDRAAERLGQSLSVEELAGVVADQSRPVKPRMLAFSWLTAREPARASKLLDTMLDDPAADLRREAVDKFLDSASGADEPAAKQIHRQALTAARDVDQVERIAQWLAEHGETVNLAEVLGFVRQWKISETFDNRQGIGFATTYPPEIAAGAADTAGWKEIASTDRLGAIDLNAALGATKGVAAYALADVVLQTAGAAEVRIGSPCAVKVWVNGVPVMTHEIYHASEAVDQYVATADFRAGTNTILVKCCQNEQTEAWAADWKFQLRICDRLGRPLASQPKDARP